MTHHGTTIPRYKMISCYSNNQHSFNTGQVVTKFTINDAASMSEPQLMAIFDDIIDDGFEIDRQLARG
jgi:hypothetical protein